MLQDIVKSFSQDHIVFNLYPAGVISLCRQYTARSACSLTRLYTVGSTTSNFHLDIPENDNDGSKKWKFKKFHLKNSAG